MTRMLLTSMLVCAVGAGGAEAPLLSLVPEDAVTVAGLDAVRIRESALGRAALDRLQENGSPFEALAAAAGFDPRRDVREVVVAYRASDREATPLVLFRGKFDADRMQALAGQTAGAKTQEHRGVRILVGVSAKGGSRAVAAPSDSLLLAGTREDVEAALDRWAGGGNGGGEVARRAGELGRGSHLWLLSREPVSSLASRTEDRHVAGALHGDLFATIQEWRVRVVLGAAVQVEAQAAAATERDAAALAEVATFLMNALRAQAPRSSAGQLFGAIQDFQATAEQNRMDLRFTLPEDRAELLLRTLPLLGGDGAPGSAGR